MSLSQMCRFDSIDKGLRRGDDVVSIVYLTSDMRYKMAFDSINEDTWLKTWRARALACVNRD